MYNSISPSNVKNTYFYVDAYLCGVRRAEKAKSLLNIAAFIQYECIYETITSCFCDASQEKYVKLLMVDIYLLVMFLALKKVEIYGS